MGDNGVRLGGGGGLDRPVYDDVRFRLPLTVWTFEYKDGSTEDVDISEVLIKDKCYHLYYGNDLIKVIPFSNVDKIRSREKEMSINVFK